MLRTCVFYSGLHLEGKMGEIFARMSDRKPMVAVTEGLPHDRLLKIGTDHFDPHVWFDVALWSQTLREVTKARDRSRSVEFRLVSEGRQ